MCLLFRLDKVGYCMLVVLGCAVWTLRSFCDALCTYLLNLGAEFTLRVVPGSVPKLDFVAVLLRLAGCYGE